ncbi:hypothetical protein [Undibacterium sp. TS12]|uniref:hypothetical protein n=1 Tax=Undibacterium sp. TS12 TaxID=2908202 RepID=UPI001F4C7619|nr:hypothetical protein [Undibacterium sp. TS12]MCH8622777.1 hypothetical protein [Undibacterium sp. TS12]
MEEEAVSEECCAGTSWLCAQAVVNTVNSSDDKTMRIALLLRRLMQRLSGSTFEKVEDDAVLRLLSGKGIEFSS